LWERSICVVWLTARYFTGSVSWLTDLTPYLPQDAAGHHEGKMAQVSVAGFVLMNTWDDWKCVKVSRIQLQCIQEITSAAL
jgi:hypothetical protein